MSQNTPDTDATAANEPAAPRRKKIKKLEVMIADVIRETPDSATLVLFTGNDQLEYRPGHFLTIDPHQFPALERFIEYFEELKGKREPARAYSLASAPHEKYLAITVKEEYYISGRTKYPPLLSPLLVWRMQPGTRMVVTGFGGPYVLPPDIESKTDHLIHVCAGSGIVPNWSIIKHSLAEDLRVRHTLVYGNKTFEDIIFRRQVEALQSQHPDRIQVVHALSREQDVRRYGEAFQSGRINRAVIESAIPDPAAAVVFACGPGIGKWERLAAKEAGTEPQPRFLESALTALEEIGVPKAQIHHESYG